MNLSKIAQLLGKKGGEQSVKSRFEGKTKEEISEIMRNVRNKQKWEKIGKEGRTMEDGGDSRCCDARLSVAGRLVASLRAGRGRQPVAGQTARRDEGTAAGTEHGQAR